MSVPPDKNSVSTSRTPATAGAASILGFSFDLFDLTILLFVAPTVSRVLFPVADPTLALAATFASFGVSLLMRPLGGIVCGRFADRLGRRRMMLISIMGVGVTTALMGALPTYAAAGAVGPTLFLLLRLLQGLFVGGVVASTHTLGTESVPQRWRGLLSGLIISSGGIGIMMAAGMLFLTSALFPGDAFDEWGWRVMFFSGLLASLISLAITLRAEESPMWAAQDANRSQAPAKARTLLGREHRGATLTSLGMVFGAASIWYLTIGFLPTFLGQVNKISGTQTAVVLLVAGVFIVPTSALIGHASERFGRRPVLVVMGVVDLVALPVLVYLISEVAASDFGKLVAASALFCLIANGTSAPLQIFLAERFPTALRATGTAMVYNAGFALGGLMTTVVPLLSPTVSDIPGRLVAGLALCAAVFLVFALRCPETRGALEAPADLPRSES
ncbi:MFS transporter [Streptomyces sp. 3N207]|uniref:MFS transporter n=1 Tax=Streptomyces sp. 3N207 TaxID=3457417 RepID=UPI003FD3E52B